MSAPPTSTSALSGSRVTPVVCVRNESGLWTKPFLRLVGVQAAFGYSFATFNLLPKHLASDLNGTPSQIGLVMAAFGVASVLTIPFLGLLTRRLGRGGAMLGANVLMALGAAGFAAVQSAGLPAIVLRGLHGVAWAVTFSTGMALVSDVAPVHRLGQAIGLAGAASLVMNAIAPALGEPIQARFGFGPVALLAGLAAVVAAAWTLPFARRSDAAGDGAGAVAFSAGSGASPPSSRASSARASGSDVVATPATAPSSRAGLYGVFGLGGLAYSVMFTFLAPFALLHGISAVRAFFVAYTIAALSVRVLGARLSDRLGHARMLRFAVPMYGAALVLMGLVGPGALLVIGLFFGVAHGAVFPALVATLVGTATPGSRPRVLGLANGAMSLGVGAVFPAGMLVERLGYPTVFIVTGALTVAAVTLVPRRVKTPSGAT